MNKKTVQVKGKFKRKPVVARTENQKRYIKSIMDNDLVICEGPAGTGKTHIAIGMAIKLLDKKKIDKIVIARPVIEAGEDIGYLPGDANAKLNPYVRPIFDELLYYSSHSEIVELQNSKVLEVVPIGYMRGRTFKDSFIIIDECQNATIDQVKMILTRFGESSKMVMTGDVTQSDLERKHQGGFQYAFDLLNIKLDEVGCVRLYSEDIVRHKLVGKILDLWEKHLDSYRKSGRIG